MNRSEYLSTVAVHRSRIEQAIHDARDAGLLFDDFEIRFRYPPDLGGSRVCDGPPEDSGPIPSPADPVVFPGGAHADEPSIRSAVAIATRLAPTGDLCPSCGSPDLRPSGACMVCHSCGTSTGCG